MLTRNKLKSLEEQATALKRASTYFGGVISVPRDRWQDRDKFVEEELERLGVDTEAKDFLGVIILPEKSPSWPAPPRN